MLYIDTGGKYIFNSPTLVLKTFSTLFEYIGRWLISAVYNFFSALEFTIIVFFRGLHYLWRYPKHNIIKQVTISQIIFSGVDVVFPILISLTLLVGLTIVSPLILFLQTFATEQEVMQMLMQLIGLQLGPIIISVVLIARSGSAIAVDLSHMSLNQEIKGLLLLGIDPYVYFAFPRFIGLAISQLALSIYFSTFSLLFGILFSGLLNTTSNWKYFFILIDSFTNTELLLFIIKNIFCGIAIAAYACFFGLKTKKSITEIPQSTQQAIMKSLLIVFFIHAIFVIIQS